jgi:hypothetical protein
VLNFATTMSEFQTLSSPGIYEPVRVRGHRGNLSKVTGIAGGSRDGSETPLGSPLGKGQDAHFTKIALRSPLSNFTAVPTLTTMTA